MGAVRRLLTIGGAFGLLVLAGCGGDETTTVTTTVSGSGAATTTAPTGPETTTSGETGSTCTSKSAPNVTDLVVTNMSCEEADSLTGEVIRSLSHEPFTVAGFECEIRGRSGPDEGPILGAEDITCTSGERTFRFSFGD
jgi:hypothetical protein